MRILIVEDHVMVREGLYLIVKAQGDMEVVGKPVMAKKPGISPVNCNPISSSWTFPCPNSAEPWPRKGS